MFQRKKKCGVCGYRFTPTKEEVYTAEEPRSISTRRSRGGGYPIVLLIPARTDTSYFHDYIYGKAEIRFIRGRLRFTDDDGNAADPAPFPSMLVIYNGERVKNER